MQKWQVERATFQFALFQCALLGAIVVAVQVAYQQIPLYNVFVILPIGYLAIKISRTLSVEK
jgi:hypothetical protein